MFYGTKGDFMETSWPWIQWQIFTSLSKNNFYQWMYVWVGLYIKNEHGARVGDIVSKRAFSKLQFLMQCLDVLSLGCNNMSLFPWACNTISIITTQLYIESAKGHGYVTVPAWNFGTQLFTHAQQQRRFSQATVYYRRGCTITPHRKIWL